MAEPIPPQPPLKEAFARANDAKEPLDKRPLTPEQARVWSLVQEFKTAGSGAVKQQEQKLENAPQQRAAAPGHAPAAGLQHGPKITIPGELHVKRTAFDQRQGNAAPPPAADQKRIHGLMKQISRDQPKKPVELTNAFTKSAYDDRSK